MTMIDRHSWLTPLIVFAALFRCAAEERPIDDNPSTRVSLSSQSGERNNRLGWWFAGDQVGTAFKPHPVLRHVPYEPSLSALFFRIVRKPIRLPIEGLGPKDVIAAGEGKDLAGLYLSEGMAIGGGRHIRISGLDVLSDTPEGTAILDGALDCMEDQ